MNKEEPIPGLRDFIAVSALSMLSDPARNTWTHKELAYECYSIADAMLLERDKRSAN